MMSRKIKSARREGGRLSFADIRCSFVFAPGKRIEYVPNSATHVGLMAGVGAALRQKWLKRACFAAGNLALAILFSYFDQQSMEFIEGGLISGQVLVEELLGCGVVVVGRNQGMSAQNAPRVRVRDKVGEFSGVEKDGVYGFRAETPQLEEFVPEQPRALCKQRIQRTLMGRLEPADKHTNSARLLPEVTGGSNAAFDLGGAGPAQPQTLQEPRRAKTFERQDRVLPCGVLRQDRPEDDFQAGACRPPTLRAESAKEHFVILFKHFTRPNFETLSRALHSHEINTGPPKKSSDGVAFRGA